MILFYYAFFNLFSEFSEALTKDDSAKIIIAVINWLCKIVFQKYILLLKLHDYLN